MENRTLERQQQRYPMARNLSKSNLGGMIFGCKHSTKAECLAKQLFGFPSPHFSYVKNIEPGLPMFLFNYTDRKLCGIYEAASHGEMSIDPSAWTQDGTQNTAFPAQVRIRIRTQCQPLMEKQFSEIIKENYYSQHHFWFELDHEQVQGLIMLFENQVKNTTDNQFNVNTELVQVGNELEEKANMLEEKQDKKKEDAGNASGRTPVKKQSAGELRLHKDIDELNLPETTVISFPNGKDDLMNFEISIRPDDGYYYGGTFIFTFQVSPSYPHEPPNVKCKTKVYHPNIDLEGNVWLNILREDWKPVLDINTIIYLLNLLFMQPNDERPLNHEADAVLHDYPGLFETNVRRAMTGGYIGQT